VQIKIAYEETREQYFIVEWDEFRRQNILSWRNWRESNLDEDEDIISEDIIDFIEDLMIENGESIIDDNQFQTIDNGRVSFDVLDVREY
jgi:hypothetical protein